MGVTFLFYIFFYQFKGDFDVGSERKGGSWRGWGINRGGEERMR